MVKTSIIIPTYHRTECLLRLLQSISEQDEKDIEILIVEQGENHKKDIVSYAKKHYLQISYIFIKHPNMPKARNVGARIAKGRYLVFYDDDVILTPHALHRLVDAFSRTNGDLIGGRVTMPDRPDDKESVHTGRISYLCSFSENFSSLVPQSVDTVIGCHMAMKKSVFDNVGGFDEHFIGNALREESDFSLRVKDKGYTVLFDPSATVVHLRAAHGGANKSDNRLFWYYCFFHNETYFFLKHRPLVLLPIYMMKKISYILRCMFGFGREVSVRSFITPIVGIRDGIETFYKVSPCKNAR